MMRFLLFLMLFAAPAGCAQKEPKRWNLLIYLIDTLRADHLGCYGYGRDTSPVIDGLAREGALFENAHVQCNWTQPSVGSLITSKPPLFYGLEGFAGDLPEAVVTLAELLKANGYRTGGFTTNTAVAPEFGFGQGFDVYREAGAELSRSERLKRIGAVFDADTLNDLALPWLRANASGPFFLYMHSVDPHAPYQPPEGFDLFDPGYEGDMDGSAEKIQELKEGRWKTDPEAVGRLISLYDGEIRFNDSEIGRLVGELKRLGVMDQTLTVIVSDHGEELYDHGTSGHGHTNLHRELTHVPLILRMPGKIPAGKRVAPLVSGLDLMPTLLDLLGVEAPRDLEGRSLAPLILSDASPAAPPMLYAFRLKSFKDLGALRTHEYLFLKRADGKQELYPLREDPEERGENLFDRLPVAQKEAWERQLNRFRQMRADYEVGLRVGGGEETFEIPKEIEERLRSLGYTK